MQAPYLLTTLCFNRPYSQSLGTNKMAPATPAVAAFFPTTAVEYLSLPPPTSSFPTTSLDSPSTSFRLRACWDQCALHLCPVTPPSSWPPGPVIVVTAAKADTLTFTNRLLKLASPGSPPFQSSSSYCRCCCPFYCTFFCEFCDCTRSARINRVPSNTSPDNYFYSLHIPSYLNMSIRYNDRSVIMHSTQLFSIYQRTIIFGLSTYLFIKYLTKQLVALFPSSPP